MEQSIPAFWYYMIAVQVCGIISTILGFAFLWLRESRNRAWDLQDRTLARTETHSKIEEVRVEAGRAYTEANHAKELIASIEEVRNNIQNKTLEVITDMKEKTAAVGNFVENIQENTGKSANALEKLVKEPLPVINMDRRK